MNSVTRQNPQEMTALEFLEIMERKAQTERLIICMKFALSAYPSPNFNDWIKEAEQWANDHPDVVKDVVQRVTQPVVRCADCKYNSGAWRKGIWCRVHRSGMHHDDYCSRGRLN